MIYPPMACAFSGFMDLYTDYYLYPKSVFYRISYDHSIFFNLFYLQTIYAVPWKYLPRENEKNEGRQCGEEKFVV